MNHLSDLIQNKNMFFHFMKEKYPVFYNSNIFFRDVQFAIQRYYEQRGEKMRYSAWEKLASSFLNELTSQNELVLNGKNCWKVNFSLENSVTNNVSTSSEV